MLVDNIYICVYICYLKVNNLYLILYKKVVIGKTRGYWGKTVVIGMGVGQCTGL